MDTHRFDPRARRVGAPAHRNPASRESGIALFIVLVLILVLTIVIFQLTFTTKVEERIAQNRQGFLEMTYTLQAVARSGLEALETDLLEDLGLIDDLEEDPADPTGGLGGPGPGPVDGRDQDDDDDAGDGEAEERFDTIHEGWGYEVRESLNEAEVVMRIIDGESRIDLNHLFEYAQVPEDEEDDDIPDDLQDEVADPNAEDDELAEGEIEEYIPPTAEEIEDAELILSRLIQGIIQTNQENDFDYSEVPDPDLAAREIVNWVQVQQGEEFTRLIRSLESIRSVPGITWELFTGPVLPEDEEDDDYDDYGDEAGGLLARFGEDLGEMPGFEQLDDGVERVPSPLGLRDVLTAHSTGKINLNTARPEVLAALLLGIEDPEEAREYAFQIDVHRNLYAVPEEEEGAAPPPIGEEEGTQEFNEFRSFSDIGKVDETWTEGTSPTILDVLRESLEPVSAFRSTFFTVRLTAERDDRTLSGTMEVVREENDIIVISWEETRR